MHNEDESDEGDCNVDQERDGLNRQNWKNAVAASKWPDPHADGDDRLDSLDEAVANTIEWNENRGFSHQMALPGRFLEQEDEEEEEVPWR